MQEAENKFGEHKANWLASLRELVQSREEVVPSNEPRDGVKGCTVDGLNLDLASDLFKAAEEYDPLPAGSAFRPMHSSLNLRTTS